MGFGEGSFAVGFWLGVFVVAVWRVAWYLWLLEVCGALWWLGSFAVSGCNRCCALPSSGVGLVVCSLCWWVIWFWGSCWCLFVCGALD